jgi:hypothetical protein
MAPLLAWVSAMGLPDHARAQSLVRLSRPDLLSTPVAAVWGPDGSAFVADLSEPAIHRIAHSGELMWSIRNKGVGPGDISRPYRIAWGGSYLFVYDFNARDISVFDGAGRFQRRFRPDLPLSTVDDLVVLGDSAIVLLGITRISHVAPHVIHVFDRAGRHLRSFGEVPVASDQSRLSMAGAGSLSPTPDGRLLYTRKGPYQVIEYSLAGRVLRKHHVPVRIGPIADSLAVIEVNASGQERIRSRAHQISFPLASLSLGAGGLIAGASQRGVITWWILPRDGVPRPLRLADGFAPSAWDSQRCLLLGTGSLDDEPVLASMMISDVYRAAGLPNPPRC